MNSEIEIDCPYCSMRTKVRNKSMTYIIKGQWIYDECMLCHAYILRGYETLPHKALYPPSYYTKSGLKKPLSYLQKKWAEHSYGMKTWLGNLCSWVMGTKHSSVGYFRRFAIDKKASILDFGCGNGQLLKMLHHLGYKALTGVDPYTIPREGLWNDEGVYAYHFCFDNEVFDVIISCHSIEHVPDVKFTLLQMYRALKPGGMLIIQCPIIPNLALSYYGKHWVGWDAPRHLTIPTVKSITQILEGECGMSKMSQDYNETTLWNYQASHDNLTYNKHSPWITKLIHFIGRFSPDPINKELRRRFSEQQKSLYSDCIGLVFIKPYSHKVTED